MMTLVKWCSLPTIDCNTKGPIQKANAWYVEWIGKDISGRGGTNRWFGRLQATWSCAHDSNPDKAESFFVGDAAGRQYTKSKADFSSTDRKWALNVGLTFWTPEVRTQFLDIWPFFSYQYLLKGIFPKTSSAWKLHDAWLPCLIIARLYALSSRIYPK